MVKHRHKPISVSEIVTIAAQPSQEKVGSKQRLRSDGGGEHWAVIASLIETCKLCNVESRNYLDDVITKTVNGHPSSQIDDLLPWGYSIAPALKEAA